MLHFSLCIIQTEHSVLHNNEFLHGLPRSESGFKIQIQGLRGNRGNRIIPGSVGDSWHFGTDPDEDPYLWLTYPGCRSGRPETYGSGSPTLISRSELETLLCRKYMQDSAYLRYLFVCSKDCYRTVLLLLLNCYRTGYLPSVAVS